MPHVSKPGCKFFLVCNGYGARWLWSALIVCLQTHCMNSTEPQKRRRCSLHGTASLVVVAQNAFVWIWHVVQIQNVFVITVPSDRLHIGACIRHFSPFTVHYVLLPVCWHCPYVVVMSAVMVLCISSISSNL